MPSRLSVTVTVCYVLSSCTYVSKVCILWSLINLLKRRYPHWKLTSFYWKSNNNITNQTTLNEIAKYFSVQIIPRGGHYSADFLLTAALGGGGLVQEVFSLARDWLFIKQKANVVVTSGLSGSLWDRDDRLNRQKEYFQIS